MRPTHLLLLILIAGSVLTPNSVSQTTQAPAADRPCWPSGTAYTRTTLYFGLTNRSGGISEEQWQDFLAKEVTPRFPDGLTTWEADGQWRQQDGKIGREHSKVLLLVHRESGSARVSVSALVSAYKRRFEQDSVLWETATVCATF